MRKVFNQAKAILILLAIAALIAAAGQDKPSQESKPPASGQAEEQRERVGGTIASVGVDRMEIKRMDGSSMTVMVDDQTRYRQGQQEIQLEDLKAGDRVFVRGAANANKEFVATLVRRMTDEEIQRFQNMGERVFGEIISIDNSQIKVRSPRTGEKTVVVNDQTVMMKDGQPITLKDLKVGDRIFAAGKETGGQFVATRLMTGQFRGPGRRESNPEH